MKNIAIVILNWNRPKDTVQCLESIGKSQISNLKSQIYVVDNGSTDDSVVKFKGLKIKNLKLKIICNDANLGFAAGNNVGIRQALRDGSDYILILNNDTVVDHTMMIRIIEAAEKYPKVGIFSPKIYFAPGFEFHKDRYQKSELGKVIWWAGGKIDWNNVYGENVGVDEVDQDQFNKTGETDFATGACMLVKKEVFEEIGLFDERYFLYLEDTDLSLRAKKAGWKIYFVPEAKLWHKIAQSSAVGSDLNDYFIHRNRLLFGLKYASLRTKLALFREGVRFLLGGRKWQRIGIRDYFLGKLGQGSWR